MIKFKENMRKFEKSMLKWGHSRKNALKQGNLRKDVFKREI